MQGTRGSCTKESRNETYLCVVRRRPGCPAVDQACISRPWGVERPSRGLSARLWVSVNGTWFKAKYYDRKTHSIRRLIVEPSLFFPPFLFLSLIYFSSGSWTKDEGRPNHFPPRKIPQRVFVDSSNVCRVYGGGNDATSLRVQHTYETLRELPAPSSHTRVCLATYIFVWTRMRELGQQRRSSSFRTWRYVGSRFITGMPKWLWVSWRNIDLMPE